VRKISVKVVAFVVSCCSQEQELKKQKELEKQLERQRQLEMEREEERRKAMEQREVHTTFSFILQCFLPML